jgi:hypothetical protein
MSAGAVNIATTSRLTIGRNCRTSPAGRAGRADTGTIVTPIPAAASWAAVRGASSAQRYIEHNFVIGSQLVDPQRHSAVRAEVNEWLVGERLDPHTRRL